MSHQAEHSGSAEGRGSVRSPQNVLGGLSLLAIAVLAVWLTSELPQGSLRAMGPAMLPRWLAFAVGLCGLALIALGFLQRGDSFERSSLRGPFFVLLAIFAFAVTIRPFTFGPISTPGLGLIVAGPLAILISGYATTDIRLRDLVILALSLTPFCMILFGDMLNLPIPIFPQSLTGLFPADWSQKQVMRATAGIMALCALGVFLLWRSNGHNRGVEVVDHSGRI